MNESLPVVPWEQARKQVDKEHAHEVWTDGSWTWYVLKKWQKDDDKPYARWFCLVDGFFSETGDVYVADVKRQAWRIR